MDIHSLNAHTDNNNNNNNNRRSGPQEFCPLVCVPMAACSDAGGGTGSARRRRERRLHAYLRYPRMSVAMALAECQHHSAQRPKKARAREEEREVHYTAAFRTTVPPPEPELFDLFEEPCGERPDLLLEPQGPQTGVQRHIVEHLADLAAMVQILDVPVPQKGEELADILKLVDTPVEQVFAVPKISNFSIQPRSVLRSPQMAEQLVEVPTVVSFALLQRHTAERIIDILVPHRRRRGQGGLQGSRAEQNSTARPVEQNVDIQVPRHRRHQGGLQGSHPGQGVLQRSVEQIAEIPVPAGGYPHLPDTGASSSPAVSRGESGHGDLHTFALDVRSARSAGSSSARVHPHSSSWTLAAYVSEEAAYPDIEYEFFDYGGLSWVRRWIPSWAGFAWWFIVLIGAGKGLGRGLSGTS